MFDAALRKVIDPPLDRFAHGAVKLGLSANTVTGIGFLAGIGATVAIAYGAFSLAMGLIIINRFLDGLDGAIARQTGPTDLGGYLDIVGDFLIYGAVPFGFALYAPETFALPAAFLLLSFIGTGSSFLAFAIVAEKRGISTDIRGQKSFYYLGGLTEGTETIACFLLCCIFVAQFDLIAWIYGALCWITVATRVTAAISLFRDAP